MRLGTSLALSKTSLARLLTVCLFFFLSVDGWGACTNIGSPYYYARQITKSNTCIAKGYGTCSPKCSASLCSDVEMPPTIITNGGFYYTNFVRWGGSSVNCSFTETTSQGCTSPVGNSVTWRPSTQCSTQEEAQEELCTNNPSADGCKTPEQECLEQNDNAPIVQNFEGCNVDGNAVYSNCSVQYIWKDNQCIELPNNNNCRYTYSPGDSKCTNATCYQFTRSEVKGMTYDVSRNTYVGYSRDCMYNRCDYDDHSQTDLMGCTDWQPYDYDYGVPPQGVTQFDSTGASSSSSSSSSDFGQVDIFCGGVMDGQVTMASGDKVWTCAATSCNEAYMSYYMGGSCKNPYGNDNDGFIDVTPQYSSSSEGTSSPSSSGTVDPGESSSSGSGDVPGEGDFEFDYRDSLHYIHRAIDDNRILAGNQYVTYVDYLSQIKQNISTANTIASAINSNIQNGNAKLSALNVYVDTISANQKRLGELNLQEIRTLQGKIDSVNRQTITNTGKLADAFDSSFRVGLENWHSDKLTPLIDDATAQIVDALDSMAVEIPRDSILDTINRKLGGPLETSMNLAYEDLDLMTPFDSAVAANTQGSMVDTSFKAEQYEMADGSSFDADNFVDSVEQVLPAMLNAKHDSLNKVNDSIVLAYVDSMRKYSGFDTAVTAMRSLFEDVPISDCPRTCLVVSVDGSSVIRGALLRVDFAPYLCDLQFLGNHNFFSFVRLLLKIMVAYFCVQMIVDAFTRRGDKK